MAVEDQDGHAEGASSEQHGEVTELGSPAAAAGVAAVILAMLCALIWGWKTPEVVVRFRESCAAAGKICSIILERVVLRELLQADFTKRQSNLENISPASPFAVSIRTWSPPVVVKRVRDTPCTSLLIWCQISHIIGRHDVQQVTLWVRWMNR